MAVTKALTKAIPYSKSSKVQEWDLEYTYENDSEGDATYYTSTFSTHVNATDSDGSQVLGRDMFVMPLIKAVQELSAEIEKLKKEQN